MLTQIFYYSHYRPYLVDTPKNNKISSKKMPLTDNKKQIAENSDFLLNKSLTAEVIRYVRNISDSVVGTKDSANNVVKDIENFNQNVFNRDYETARRWIAEDLEDFVNSYNFSLDFLNNQEHSRVLKIYAEVIQDIISDGMDRLWRLGIMKDDNNALSFNLFNFNATDKTDFNLALGENINIFDRIYQVSSHTLTIPMTHHMNFKGLSYYYNYRMGTVEDETFKIIESGLIVNQAI